ncbi:hypothetical protein IFT68_14105 [Oxalobacteraceae sp. CFBP 13730]|nr:hypothetical protein [Oxalobacteraceae sp. CFBP 13730]
MKKICLFINRLTSLTHSSLRIAIVFVALILLNIYIIQSESLDRIFNAAFRAFQGSFLIFSICVSLATLLAVNYVRGLGEAYWKRVERIRALLDKLYTDHKSSELAPVQQLVNEFVLPMLYLTNDDWCLPDQGQIRELMESKTQIGIEFLETGELKFGELPWGIIRIEEEFDGLIVQYLKRVVSEYHAREIAGSFLLMASAIGSLTLIYLLPSTPVGKLLGANLSIAMIAFAIVEMLLFSRLLGQQLLEEYPENLEGVLSKGRVLNG